MTIRQPNGEKLIVDNEIILTHEMSDERYFLVENFQIRFQELLDESRKWKSEWIDNGREESEVNLVPLLTREKNILRLTNQLHANPNQFDCSWDGNTD